MNNSNISKPRHADMLIKVCGMREPENIAYVASLTPMLMGFIFYEKSKRYVGDLSPEVIASLPSYINPVALMVNPTSDEVIDVTTRYGIKIVQLHGEETPEFCQSLRAKNIIVLKGIPITDAGSIEALKRYHGSVDAFVFDSKSPGKGGSGQKFNWDILEKYDPKTPYLLAGGIGPDDVDQIITAMRPGMIGIDINSRFETEPGIKDISLLTHFILSLRKFNEDDTPAKPFWEKA